MSLCAAVRWKHGLLGPHLLFVERLEVGGGKWEGSRAGGFTPHPARCARHPLPRGERELRATRRAFGEGVQID